MNESQVSSTTNWPLKKDNRAEYLACNDCYYPIVEYAKVIHVQFINNPPKNSFWGYEVNINNLLKPIQTPTSSGNERNQIFCFECCKTLTFLEHEFNNSVFKIQKNDVAILNEFKVFIATPDEIKQNYLKNKNKANQ